MRETSRPINDLQEAYNGWHAKLASSSFKRFQNWAITTWSQKTNAGMPSHNYYATWKEPEPAGFAIAIETSTFLATQTAPGQTICIAVDLQQYTLSYSIMAQFLGLADDKQPFLHQHAKRSILYRPKLNVKLFGFEASWQNLGFLRR